MIRLLLLLLFDFVIVTILALVRTGGGGCNRLWTVTREPILLGGVGLGSFEVKS